MRNLAKILMGGTLFGLLLWTSSGTSEAGLLCCRDCCPPPPPQKVVLQVCHPCTGCKYNVPVCIPACCTGAPTVCYQDTIVGDGKVVFQWCCGHKVIVRFPACGGYRVVQRKH
jgi:hypothetical protein